MTFRVLVAASDRGDAARLLELCRELSCEASLATDTSELRGRVERGGIDVCLLDVGLAERDPEILSDLAALAEAPSVVISSTDADRARALELLRAGAASSVRSPAEVGDLACALQAARTERAARLLRDHLARAVDRATPPLLGRSRPARRVAETIARIATTPKTTVLITGEAGVGKERIARVIHQESSRSSGPFVPLTCAELAGSQLEEELFGREPDAGGSARAGRLSWARGGTLYLDEVSALDAETQARLSRTLTDRTWRRVGGQVDVPLDVRLIVATTRNLSELVDSGRFDEELYYRINVMTLAVPPLRDRTDDVALFANAFLERASRRLGRRFHAFTHEAMTALEAHAWPGNLLELESVVQLAALRSPDGEIQASHLALGGTAAMPETEGAVLPIEDLSMKSMERALIERVLDVARGNRSHAARMLQVNRTTLYNKLKAYGLEGDA